MNQLKAVLLTLVAALSFASAPPLLAEQDSMRPPLKINRSQSDMCVEPTEIMRNEHMNFLLHQRDETLRKGVRSKQHSLKECVNCHANKDEQGKYLSVNAPGEFCSSCHTYASVKIDCFECHATKPRQTAFHPLVSDKMQAWRDAHGAGESNAMLNELLNHGKGAAQ